MPETRTNDTTYIQKEVFEARMDRMEALMEKTILEVRAENEKFRSELKEEIGTLRGEMGNLRSEVMGEISNLRGEMGDLRAELKEDIHGLRTEIRVLDERITSTNFRVDALQTTVYWGFTLLTLVIALVSFSPSIAEFLKNLRKPPITLEDVERIVNTAIQRASLSR